MKAKNRVIAGYLNGHIVDSCGIQKGIFSSQKIDKSTVESYEVLNQESHKSGASGVTRGIIGGALLGPVGMVAGAASAKNNEIYQIKIVFKDGNESLIEVDNALYKQIIRMCF